MTKNTTLNPQLLVFGIPILLIASMVLLAQSAWFMQNPNTISTAITLDLLLTLPLVYFLIIRKKDIPKFTVVSVFVVGIALASFILPENHQSLLSQVKTFVLPVLELGIISIIIVKARKTVRHFRLQKEEDVDFFTAIKHACREVLPARISTVMATEVAVLYYSLSSKKLQDLKPNEFSYHEKSSVHLILFTFMGLALMETLLVHFLVQMWSHKVAWILTFLSVYTCFQLFALVRSMSQRPIFIDHKAGNLELRYGFFSEATIPLDDIEQVVLSSRSLPDEAEMVQLSPLGMLDSYNLIIHLKNHQTLHGFYGNKKTFKAIGVFLDEKEHFRDIIKTAIAP